MVEQDLVSSGWRRRRRREEVSSVEAKKSDARDRSVPFSSYLDWMPCCRDHSRREEERRGWIEKVEGEEKEAVWG